jgi:rare lipoprotein A
MAIKAHTRSMTTRVVFSNALLLAGALSALVACSTATKQASPTSPTSPAPNAPSSPSKPGGYYKDDGPGDNPPANLDTIPDAVPRAEPLNRFANRPYTVFGREYVPATSLRPYKERGIASWYGRKFHNQKTSSGEVYDMYAMTAAHPTLPLPSYARVTNVATGKSVIVRVNDRGPFHPGRVIDLSFAAASRIGIAQKGSGEVEVESLLPGDAPATAGATPLPPVATAGPAQAIPIGEAAGGYVVQLGAFSNNANAQSFIEQLANQSAGLGVEPKTREAGGLYRVYVGPYATRDEAARTAERLRSALGLDSTLKTQ